MKPIPDFSPHLHPGLDQASLWIEPQSLTQLMALMTAACRAREEALGDEVEFCAIVNARSGLCSEDCAFCAQSQHYQATAEAYPLLAWEEIVALGRRAAGDGACRFGIVTSGRSCPQGRELDEICRAVDKLRKESKISPCVSLGLLSPRDARRLADAGCVRYHHNLEAGPSHFARVCTTHAYEDRVAAIQTAKDAGLETCVGGIVGLGESPWERAELAQACAGLDPDSIPLNFLNPIPGTPLEGLPTLSVVQALAAVAVFRLTAPGVHLRTCGGRQQVLGRLSGLMYLAGASATMTGNYLTTRGGKPREDLNDLDALGLLLKTSF